MPGKAFYDAVRPLFGGRLKQHQVDGLTKIVTYGTQNGYSRADLAYVLATIFHETAKWMQPIREGARRYGPAYSHQSAIRAVTAIYSKGIIRRNYSLPAGPYGQSYYGRGLVQITWYENYQKFAAVLGIDLVKNPDLALEWDTALDICFIGMRDGVFRSASLDDVPDDMTTPAFDAEDRDIINGDVKKYGDTIAGYASVFFNALEEDYGNPCCGCNCTA